MQSTPHHLIQYRHNLPTLQTSFIGREHAVNQVHCRLRTSRLLTITGSGGSGKTRLALRVAQSIAECGMRNVESERIDTPHSLFRTPHFKDGVWWVDLAALTDPALVPQTVAAALGLQQQAGQSFTALLTEHLRNRRALLVLDNCEHLRHACADLLTALLANVCTVRILATSREPLAVEGEQIWAAPMLALPDLHAPLSLEELQQVEAVRLFTERARAVFPAFTLHERNADAVAQVCQRLDGLPLAIELAAARTNVLTPKQLAERLDDSMHLLTRAAPASESRHQTLRAALDWSFDLLSPEEQAFFTRLASFVGSFTFEAVEAICTGEGLARDDLLDLLASLVEKSLVLAGEQGDEMRYRLLEPIRQYAVERLRDGAEETRWREQHATWYLALAERAEPALHSLEQLAWLDRLTQDHDNLRAALAWFAATKQVEAGLRLSSALFPFWRVRGYFSEGQRWLETFLQRSDSASASAAHINALNGLARLHTEQSDFTTAHTLYEQSLTLARQAGYDQGCDFALIGLGLARWELGDFPAAYTVLAEAVQRCRAAQRLPTLARALRTLSLVHWSQGELFAARTCCAESVALARQTDDAGNIAGALFNLALMTTHQGEYAEARRLYEECLAINRQFGDKSVIADVLINLGQLAIELGDFAPAAVFLNEAAQLHLELGDQGDTAYSLANLADIAFYTGNYAQARTQYQEALTLFRAAGNKRMIGRALGWLGAIACREGDLPTAATFCAEALTLRHAIGHKAGVIFSFEEGYAELAVAVGQPAVAARLLAVTDGLYEEMSRTRAPITARAVEQLKATLHVQLGEVAFAAAWGEGQRMNLDEAVAYALDTLSPAVVTQPRPALRFFALGPARVYRGERLLTSADWTYAKARELVFYLLYHPNVTREQIGLEFWPDASSEQVRKRLSAALAHARNALGRDIEWITFTEGHYSINRTHATWFDVDVFETRLREARRLMQNGGADERIAGLLEEAVKLHQGDFAEDMQDSEWVAIRRQALRQGYLDALFTLGCIYVNAGRAEQAIATFQRALNHDAYLEEAHLELIRCYARLNQRGQALRQYEILTQVLAELEVTPSPEVQALIERLRHNQPL